MKKKNIRIGIIAVLLVISGLLYGYYGFLYKSARNVSGEDAAFAMQAHGLAGEYVANAQKADSQYLNKAIEINGKVTEIRDSLIILDDKVVCGFDVKPANAAVDKNITVKGRCIGFDELFGEVKLDQCTIKQ
ncbi:OB-fold protein [Flavobacterium hauense]